MSEHSDPAQCGKESDSGVGPPRQGVSRECMGQERGRRVEE